MPYYYVNHISTSSQNFFCGFQNICNKIWIAVDEPSITAAAVSTASVASMMVLFLAGVSGLMLLFVILWWRIKAKEKEEQQVFTMVEQIIGKSHAWLLDRVASHSCSSDYLHLNGICVISFVQYQDIDRIPLILLLA